MNRFAHFAFQLFTGNFILVGCMIVRAPSPEELRALDQPPANVVAKVENLLPCALEWYDRVEAELLPQERLLSDAEMVVARQRGVIQPERVRIVVLENFPMLERLAGRRAHTTSSFFR